MDYLLLYYIVLASFFPLVWFSQYTGEKSGYSLFIATIMVAGIILFFGYRPEDFGTDTRQYLASFGNMQAQGSSVIFQGKDIGFRTFMWLSIQAGLSRAGFLTACACLYVLPLVYVFKKIFGKQFLIPFFLLICSFFFINYGNNIMRSGIAYSFFMLAITERKKYRQLLWFVLASTFHMSILLLFILFYLQKFVRIKPRGATIVWITFLFVAYFSKSIFAKLLGVLNIDTLSSRIDPYISSADMFMYTTGFRIDFVIFSLFFLLFGLWLQKKVYTDTFYNKLLNTYILSNAVFLLTMEYPYADRYGILSWSLIPVLIMYPIIKTRYKYHRTIAFLSIVGMYIFSINLLF